MYDFISNIFYILYKMLKTFLYYTNKTVLYSPASFDLSCHASNWKQMLSAQNYLSKNTEIIHQERKILNVYL